MRTQRMLFGVLLLLSAVVAPFWATALLMVLGFLLYSRFFEAVGVAAFIELVYRGEGNDLFGSYVPFAILLLIMLFMVEFLRTFIRERAT